MSSANLGEETLEAEIRRSFERYTTKNLKGIESNAFRSYVESSINSGISDSHTEDMSVVFKWGHNHDFGEFSVQGAMGDRHINLMKTMCGRFPVSLKDFNGKDVLDIGCWTGGTTLLMAALGSRVLAIEPVKKSAEMASFLVKSFGIESKVDVHPVSIYSLDAESFYDRFDLILFPGVIYHLTDPVIALRVLFNSCRVHGQILVESAGINSREPYLLFKGGYVYDQKKKEYQRRNWNWFRPSPAAMHNMLREVGFDEVQTFFREGRVYGYGKKLSEVQMRRDGLSIPEIK
ncbi:class I SAM-dependent methyltransferase [Fibrobacterota bacterium]